MESAYIFLLIALAFGVAFGVLTGRAPWVAGAICAAVTLATFDGSLRRQLFDVANSFLIVVVGGYFAVGFAGASFGNRFSLRRPGADRKAAVLAIGKRATVIATVVLGWLFVSYLVHFLFPS